MSNTSRISPTAHYTGTIWARHGLSHPALAGALSPALFHLARPAVWATAPLVGGLSLELALLQRHRLLDALLDRAIETRGVRQVVEIAAGLSARGLRVMERHAGRGLVYVEGDLPDMAARKRQATEGLRRPGHHVIALNALVDEGPTSLRGATAALLDPGAPTALLTEGLLLYFSREQVEALWDRIGAFLAGFPSGVYLSDLISGDILESYPPVDLFFRALSVVARGRVRTHFDGPDEAVARLARAGFREVRAHEAADWRDRVDVPVARGPELQRYLEAWTEGGAG